MTDIWHLDESLPLNEEVRFKMKNRGVIKQLVKSTHFTKTELEFFVVIYYKIWKTREGYEGMSRMQLQDVLHESLQLTDYRILDNILAVFTDKGPRPIVSVTNWANMCSLFLRGTIEEKIEYGFKVYTSVSMKPYLSRRSIWHLLVHSLIRESDEDEEEVRDMVDMIIAKMDVDRDGVISFEDYRCTVMKNPFMLEVFGQILPTRLSFYAFLSTAMVNRRKF